VRLQTLELGEDADLPRDASACERAYHSMHASVRAARHMLQTAMRPTVERFRLLESGPGLRALLAQLHPLSTAVVGASELRATVAVGDVYMRNATLSAGLCVHLTTALS